MTSGKTLFRVGVRARRQLQALRIRAKMGRANRECLLRPRAEFVTCWHGATGLMARSGVDAFKCAGSRSTVQLASPSTARGINSVVAICQAGAAFRGRSLSRLFSFFELVQLRARCAGALTRSLRQTAHFRPGRPPTTPHSVRPNERTAHEARPCPYQSLSARDQPDYCRAVKRHSRASATHHAHQGSNLGPAD